VTTRRRLAASPRARGRYLAVDARKHASTRVRVLARVARDDGGARRGVEWRFRRV